MTRSCRLVTAFTACVLAALVLSTAPTRAMLCTFSGTLSTAARFGSAGGQRSLGVATDVCAAHLTTLQSWIHVSFTPPASPGGMWGVTLTVDPNPNAAARVGVIGTRDPLGSGLQVSQAGVGPPAMTAGDFDGDGRADPLVRANGGAYVRLPIGGSGASQGWQQVSANVQPWEDAVTGDFDGDGFSELAMFYAPGGTWRWLASASAFWDIWWSGPSGETVAAFGESAVQRAFPADYDGDGRTDLAFYDNTTFRWSIFTSTTRERRDVNWGVWDARAAPADFDGDGKVDTAFYRPTDSYWYILRSSDGQAEYVNWGGGWFDVESPADFDGDGRADVAFYRPSDFYWYIRLSSTGRARYVYWGAPDVLPMPADYDGDGKADVAFFRPWDHTWYIVDSSTQRARYETFNSFANTYTIARVSR